MTKCFLDDGINQSLMMPPSLHDWLREDHLARFVADLVPSLDLSAFFASYEEKDGRGKAAYHPAFESAGGIVSASAGAVSGGGPGDDGTCRVGWNQEAGERQQAQGDEL